MKAKDKTTEELNDLFNQQYDGASELNGIEPFLARLEYAETREIDQPSLADQWIKIFKGAFLFLPGVLFLFVCAQGIFFHFFIGNFFFGRILVGIPWMLFWGFAIIYAIGNIKNLKHLYIPLSIVVTGFITFLTAIMLGEELGASFLSSYTVYLLPLVYAVPILVKDFIESDSEDS